MKVNEDQPLSGVGAERADEASDSVAGQSLRLWSHELQVIKESPEALTALIDYHEQQSTMAEAMGYSTEWEDGRIVELRLLRSQAETLRAQRCNPKPVTSAVSGERVDTQDSKVSLLESSAPEEEVLQSVSSQPKSLRPPRV